MIDLYTWTTGNGRKIPIMLEETGLPYRIHWVNLRKREQFAPDYLEINPNNKIPTIVDQDGPGGQPLPIFESGAILVYLAQKSGMFLPADIARQSKVLQWLFFQVGHVGPTFGQLNHFKGKFPDTDDYGKTRFIKETQRVYGVLEKRLLRAEYLADEYSIADMATYPWVKNHEKHSVDMTSHPAIARWMAAIEARRAVQRANAIIDRKRREALAEAAG